MSFLELVLEDIFLQPMTKKTVLVFINDSLGELDWIQPFILESQNQYSFSVYLNLPGKTREEKKKIFDNFFKQNSAVIHLDGSLEFPLFLSWLDANFNSVLRRLGYLYFPIFLVVRRLIDYFRKLVGKFMSLIIKAPEFDIIFRDYNLNDSFFLSMMYASNPGSKICIFPHSTAIESNSERTPKNRPKRIKADIFFENTKLSTHFSKPFKDIFIAVGSPSIEQSVKSPVKIANYSTKSFLFITRNCDPRFFGINYVDCGKVFLETLSWAKENDYKVFVKHHPRDNLLSYWQSLQAEFDNIEEVEYTLNDFSSEIAFGLCFYTSVGLLLTGRSVPIFDISPYKGDPSRLPFHFKNDNFAITHELVEYGMYDQFTNFKDFTKSLSHDFLRLSAMKHKENLEKYFPRDTNSIIHKSLLSLFN